MTATFEQLEPLDMLANPAAAYPYVPIAGRLFHPRTADIGPLEVALTTTTLHTNTELQSLLCELANEPAIVAATGVDWHDPRQGALSDCGLIAALGEIALRKPADLASDISTNPDGTLTVRLWILNKWRTVNVTADLPCSAGEPVYASGPVLWPAYCEKAYAAWFSSYGAIEGTFAADGLAAFTGQATVFGASTGDEAAFISAWNAGQCVCFVTPVQEENPALVPNHVYFVVNFDAAVNTVTLGNPWDSSTISESWAQVENDFLYYDRTAA